MSEKINAPSWLSTKAKQEFKRLYSLREYKPDEIDRLAEYAHTIVAVYRLRKIVDDEGEVLVSPRTGAAYANPSYNILTNLQGRMDKLRDKLFPPPKTTTAKKKTLRDTL